MGASPVPSPMPSSLPSAAVSVAPLAIPSVRPFVDADASRLLKEFKKALVTQVQALEHRQKFEIADLKAAQKAQYKEWEKKEREARHKYFSANPKGPDRRAYVKEFIDRRTAFFKIQSDDLTQRKNQNEVRIKAMKEDHSTKLKEFQEYLARKEWPPERLWPQPGQ